MPVPSSGQLRLRADIALEVDGSDTGDNVSLGTLADSAGFDTPPDTMSEFYGYVSYTTPTISGTPSTSNVYDTSMTINSPTYTNPSAGNVTLGFYIGTSTTATNNSFYSVYNSNATSGSFSRNHSTSGGTTYYIWAVVRDTESPARFTEVLSNMKTQTTQPAVSYSTDQPSSGGNRMISRYEMPQSGNSNYGNSNVKQEYNHVYYGWTTITNNNAGGGQGSQVYPEISSGSNWIVKYRSGAATSNRATLSIVSYSNAPGAGPKVTASKGRFSDYLISSAYANGYYNETSTRTQTGAMYAGITFYNNTYYFQSTLDWDVSFYCQGVSNTTPLTNQRTLTYTYNV